jgi:6-phosphogluconolactonase
MASFRFYVGTFTRSAAQKEGIFWYQLDGENGQLTPEGTAEAGPNPAFLTLSADGRFLYTVNETAEFHGQKGGGISSFAIDPPSGGLTFLNSQPTFGESPCYVSLDHAGKWALVANYFGGSVATYPVLGDGRLGEAADFIQHVGHGPNPERQDKPHAHSIRMAPGNHIALAADLGLDELKLYHLDQTNGKLTLSQPAAIHVHPGAGPRHFDFHPNGKWLYLVDELDSTLVAYECDFAAGVYRHLQTVSTLPEGYTGQKWAAEIRIHPNGRLVFASNRGHDSIAAFRIVPPGGRVDLLWLVHSGGRTPRNFAIDPSGRWLVAANQDSDNLVVFALNPETGMLTATGIEVSVPSPVCVKFTP